MDPSMSGLYGLGSGNQTDPNDLSQMLRMHSLMTMMQPSQGKSGPGSLGQSLMAAMLMNPKAIRGWGQGIENGLGNWFSGNSWDGMVSGSTLKNLSNQASANIAGGAAL